MADMGFDYYYEWLGIKPQDQPPNLYRLLGLDLFESNQRVIENAADRQTVHLRSFATGPRGTFANNLLNEVAQARVCLLNPERKQTYDQMLHGHLYAATYPAQQQPAYTQQPTYAPPPQEPASVALPPPISPYYLPPPQPAKVPQIQSSPTQLLSNPTRGLRESSDSNPFFQLVSIIVGGAVGIGLAVLIVYLIKSNFSVNQSQQEAVVPKSETVKPKSIKKVEIPRNSNSPPKQSVPNNDKTRQEKQPPTLSHSEQTDPPPLPPVSNASPEVNKSNEMALKETVAVPSKSAETTKIAVASETKPLEIIASLNGRKPGAKKILLDAFGGTPSTEASVKLGLEWLVRSQNPDGSWSLAGPYANGALNENVTSATAMALLAFQGAGHTTETGEFRSTVLRGWKALLAMQDRKGNFALDTSVNQSLYSQAQATTAICELYGMTKNAKYAGPAELAIKFALNSQAKAGGWRYTPNVDTDTSVTGWFLMALQTARMADIDVPQESLDNIGRWLDSVATENSSKYRYQRQKPADVTMTAEGLLCRQYLGWERSNESLQSGVKFVLQNPINYDRQNIYYWYYATQLLHHMEGEAWQEWNSIMREEIPARQEKNGKEKGSWSPLNDEWGHQGGRLYVTCLSIYNLEVYYRHLPIYSSVKFESETTEKDEDKAAIKIADITSEIVQALKNKLKDVSDEERHQAVLQLNKMGAEAVGSMSDLARVVENDRNDSIRGDAVRAMIAIDPISVQVRKILSKCLLGGTGTKPVSGTGNINKNRFFAIQAVVSIGEEASWAAPILEDLTKLAAKDLGSGNNDEIFKHSVKAIGSIKTKSSAIIYTLKQYRIGNGLKGSNSEIQAAIKVVDETLKELEVE